MIGTVRRLLATAFVILGASAPSAAAASLNFYPGGSITTRSAGVITFESGLGIHVTCSLELSGSLSSGLIPATEGTTYGTLTRAGASGCSGGTVRPLIEARSPWSLTYKAILGTLPESVTGLEVYISSARVLVEISGIASCLYEARLGVLVALERFRAAEYSLRALRLVERDETFRLVTTLSGICPTTPSALGSFGFAAENEQIVEVNALVRPGLLRLNPNPIVMPKEENGNLNWREMNVKVTNGAGAGSEELRVVANTINFTAGEFQVIANNCGNQMLAPAEANECTLTVEYFGPMNAIRLGTLHVGWIPVPNTPAQAALINASTH